MTNLATHLTPGQAARALRISGVTLWRWRRRGKIRAVALPDGWIYPAREVERIRLVRGRRKKNV